jgi:hypothetical protein
MLVANTMLWRVKNLASPPTLGSPFAFAMHEPGVIWLRRAAKSIRLNSTSSSCLERSDHATRHDLLSVSGKRSALSCTRPSWQMVRVSLHAPCVCRQRAGGPPPTEPGSKELGQMCSLHADRLQEGRQADGSDCTWKSWGNGDVFTETYIDKGAHPNVLSLGQYLDFTDRDENNGLKNTGLECSDEEAVRPTCKQPLCQRVCARSWMEPSITRHRARCAAPGRPAA